jgi:DhnA family fructose-bisphosphate aldolase class Ia
LTGREIRLGKLFPNGQNAVIVAVDHGEFDGPLPGMINLPETVKKIHSGVSGILLSPGMIAHCGHAFNYKGAPQAIVRLNWSTVYAFHWEYNDAETVQAIGIEDAVAAGADAVLVSLTLRTGSEERDAANVELFCRLANEAKKLGIPVVGEYFTSYSARLPDDELHEQIYRACRILAELGADMIKTFYTPNFTDMTDSCPIPILGLGAEKLPKQIQALELAERIVQEGGRGVVFGRNAIQVPDPIAFQKALCEVVQKGVTAADAAKNHNLAD